VELAALVRSSLDRAVEMMDRLAPGWDPTSVSRARHELEISSAGNEALRLLQSRLSLLLLACAGLTESVACSLEGNALVGVPPLARQSVEHAAAIAWVLDPGLSFDERVGRVLLLEDEGLEHDLRSRDVEHADRLRTLDALHDAARKFMAHLPQDAVVMRRRQSNDSGGDAVTDSAGKHLDQPALESVSGQRLTAVHNRVRAFYRLLKAPYSPYSWLSTRTHVSTTVLSRSRMVGPAGRLVSIMPSRELELSAVLAVHSLAVSASAIVRWHGIADDGLDAWEDEIEAVLPGYFGPPRE
jgi:hypothetical protein